MPPVLALILYVGFIGWLFIRSHKLNPEISPALWIPLVWTVILASRPFSLWFGMGGQLDASVDYSEGSPMDRLAFLSLIVAGIVVLARRQAGLSDFIASNKWLCAFYLFWAASLMWSPASFVSLKRLIKDLGNVLMVLIILTDRHPIAAVRALFDRITYLLIPLSVLFIKYYPDVGRVYNHWTWQPTVTGVTTDKNALGELVLICGLFFLWKMSDDDIWESKWRDRKELLANGILVVMMFWLMKNANSATSLVCLMLGFGLFAGSRLPAVARKFRHLEFYTVVGVIFILFFNLIFPVAREMVEGLGRNMTFTDRTDIWHLALGSGTNPLLGTGFYSYWETPASLKVTDVFEGINQAHDGFVETYLNGGMVAEVLLIMMLLQAYLRLKRQFLAGSHFSFGLFVLLLASLIHNVTEASFNRMDIIWFVSLLAVANVPRIISDELQAAEDKADGNDRENYASSFDSENVAV